MWQLLLFPESDDSAQLSQVLELLWYFKMEFACFWIERKKKKDLLDVLDMDFCFFCRLKQKSF